MSMVPGGKYRLSELQVGIERLLASTAYSVRALGREPSIIALDIDEAAPWRSSDRDGRVRTALNRMEKLGLVRRIHTSEHRYLFVLTDEGHVDLAARGAS